MRLIPFLLSLALACLCHCDDSPGPGFFLKITKNVPRLGRRSESFFTKNSKTIPRIGRRDEELKTQKMFSDMLPSISKRMMMSGPATSSAVARELSVVQPVNSNTLIELLSKDAISSDNVKFVHWKDFDRALQSDMDLYRKVISLGRAPDQRLKEDLGLNTLAPVSFFSASSGPGENYYFKPNNEIYGDEYEREVLRYNDLK